MSPNPATANTRSIDNQSVMLNMEENNGVDKSIRMETAPNFTSFDDTGNVIVIEN